MRGLRDMHAHVVYGVDDGAKTEQDMYNMLDEAHRNKVSVLYCTAHSTPGAEEFPQERYDRHLEAARAYCKEKNYPIRILSGSEVLYTPALRNYIERYPLPTMGDTNFVLMEFYPNASFQEVSSAVQMLNDHAYVPILAHIERYACMDIPHAKRLKELSDVRYQVNCSTVLNTGKKLGFIRARTIRHWFRTELIDYVSSDYHNTSNRPNRMLEAWKVLRKTYGEAYAKRLMTESGNESL